jgi:pyruvate/2-oxoglutarate dehydrogenase complex dihydrolipoamide acyltransferase (E2) component
MKVDFGFQACSLALLQYPVLNCHFDPKKELITYKGSHNIGVAMDTSQGLLVPVVKNVRLINLESAFVNILLQKWEKITGSRPYCIRDS